MYITYACKIQEKVCLCGLWAFYYHHSSVLTFISSTAHSVILATIDPMWIILTFLHQDLILYNWTPANLPVTIIFNHTSDLLFIFTVDSVQSGIWCSMCINVGSSIHGQPEFSLIPDCSYE